MMNHVARRMFHGKLLVVLAMTFMAGAVHAQSVDKQSGVSQGITGTWQGTLELPANKSLRLVLKIAKANDGGLTGNFYSIDQTGKPFPIERIKVADGDVKFEIPAIGGGYEGSLSKDGTSITGTWVQGDPLPLVLTRVNDDAAWTIPAYSPPKKMAADAKPGFDVVTIKPSEPGKPGKWLGYGRGHYKTFNTNVNDLIATAYGLHAKQILNAPPWLGTDLYDLDGIPDAEGDPSEAQQQIMLQKLLADRFALKFHHEKRELAVFTITVAKGGPKLTKSTAAPDDPIGFNYRKLGQLTVRNLTIAGFATWMQASAMDRPVVDQTGLTDRYDFKLNWTPDGSQFEQFRGTGWVLPAPSDDPNAPPSLSTAIQEQLGLKMESVKAMDDVIVIDHVEKPSAN
jgi:uncharacterized protein (TIGR03435 family)